MSEVTELRFFRITIIGASNSGKTSLIASFVNGVCPARYIKTDKTVVYYKKVEVEDEGEYEDVKKPIFVEIEDTPGSERGHENDDDDFDRGNASGGSGVPKIQKGARVVLEKDRAKVMAMFKENPNLQWRPAMASMLGREFSVKRVGKDGSCGLLSPDGSEGGVWSFPAAAVTLKVSITLPIDQYLDLGEKTKPVFESLKDRKKYAMDLQRPLSAHERPIGNPDSVDKTVTRNRMGYFICFDISDDSGDSFREALVVYGMLKKSLSSRNASRLKPHIWLIGCKADRTSSQEVVRMNMDSAKLWSDQEQIPFLPTSARHHEGVQEVFCDMIQAISCRENLWGLEGIDNEEDQGEEASACWPQ